MIEQSGINTPDNSIMIVARASHRVNFAVNVFVFDRAYFFARQIIFDADFRF